VFVISTAAGAHSTVTVLSLPIHMEMKLPITCMELVVYGLACVVVVYS